MSNERVALLEARYKDIELKDNGAYGMEHSGDPWTLISWDICGREYLLLERREIVKDVLPTPLPRNSPEAQIATCSADGTNLNGTAVVFVLKNDMKWPRNVDFAWQISNKKLKFERITAKEIVCAK